MFEYWVTEYRGLHDFWFAYIGLRFYFPQICIDFCFTIVVDYLLRFIIPTPCVITQRPSPQNILGFLSQAISIPWLSSDPPCISFPALIAWHCFSLLGCFTGDACNPFSYLPDCFRLDSLHVSFYCSSGHYGFHPSLVCSRGVPPCISFSCFPTIRMSFIWASILEMHAGPI